MLGSREQGRTCTSWTNLKRVDPCWYELIFDGPSARAQISQTFWSSRNLLRPPTLNAHILDFVSSTRPEQWAASGRKLLLSGERYKEAIHCFKRGDSPRELRIAEAFQLREDVKCILEADKRHSAFVTTADAFHVCAEEATGSERIDYYRNAAECYALAGQAKKAADFYILCSDFEEAAKQYDHARRRDKIVCMFEAHHRKISPNYGGILFTICRQYYCHQNIRYRTFSGILSVHRRGDF